MKAFPHELVKQFNDGDEPQDFELGLLFQADTKNILESLDEQARATIKTILLVEYSRCNKISNEAVVKFFEGIDFVNVGVHKNDVEITKALKTIKGKR